MVALQILVLTVGVRILLGELKAEQLFQPFFVEFPYFTVFVWFLRLSVQDATLSRSRAEFDSRRNRKKPSACFKRKAFCFNKKQSFFSAMISAAKIIASFYSLTIAFASWSAQEVPFIPQMFPAHFALISSAVIPSSSLEIIFRFPLQPPLN